MQNSKKLIEKITEKREELLSYAKRLYKESLDNSYNQGMTVGINIDVDGEINEFAWTQGTSSMGIYNGDAVEVYSWTVNNDLDGCQYSFENLSEKELEEIKKFLIENEYVTNEEIEENEWYYAVNYATINEFDSDIVGRITNEYIELCVDQFAEEDAEKQIDATLEMLSDRLED